MVCKVALGEVFIPKSMGNDSDANPVKFHIKYLTVADRCDIESFIVPIGVTKKNVRVKLDLNEAFLKSVQSIENLSVNDKQITNASDFASLPGFDEMYKEVCIHIKEIEDVEKKS